MFVLYFMFIIYMFNSIYLIYYIMFLLTVISNSIILIDRIYIISMKDLMR